MRARAGYAVAAGPLLLMMIATLGGGACEATNLGEPPPQEQFFFPAGLLLDPVERDAEVCDAIDLPGPRYLYVSNGNNDRSFNAGTVFAVDLRAFWRAWYDPATGGVDPYCHEVSAACGSTVRCVLPPATTIAAGAPCADEAGLPDGARCPCRRLPLLPHVVECDEESFVATGAQAEPARVNVGDFATTLTHSIEGDAVRLWLPVRGDPSVTYVDVVPSGDGIRLDCAQDPDDPLDPRLCGDAHRLDRLRNDESLDSLDREPFNIEVWERTPRVDDPAARGQRLGFVAHVSGSQMSVIDLDGVRGGREPAMVDFASVYQFNGTSVGGFGLVTRPCFAAGEGPQGDADPEPNIPTITEGCTRPLVYTSFRAVGLLASFTASGLELGAAGSPVDTPAEQAGAPVTDLVPDTEREGCSIPSLSNRCTVEATSGDSSTIRCDLDACGCSCGEQPPAPDADGDPQQAEDQRTARLAWLACIRDCTAGCASRCDAGCREAYAGQYCATPDQLEQPCALECEPRVRSVRRIQPSLLFDSSDTSSAVLGDIAFADARGDQLLVLQTNPGALLSLDTSLGADNEPRDIPSAPPVEICAEPSRMTLYTEYDRGGTDTPDDDVPVQRYALISCFRAALVYVVDIEALRVVDAIVVGTGPHDIAVDEAREVAYVINNLESSISVIDLSRRRPTRFQELARLGLQDPFSQ